MRALLPGLESPHPLGFSLPALYQEDDFSQRFVSAFDEVLAPIFCTLDNLDAYLDPMTAPPDFVEWLAEWVGLALDENWPLEQQRSLVASAGELYRYRGTVRGLQSHVELYTGVSTEIVDSGGCVWSAAPGGTPPGSSEFKVIVRLHPEAGVEIELTKVEAIVAAAKPAHVLHEVEVISG
jgi:phage tail-like protein